MMDPAQLNRYNHNWDISLVLSIILLALSIASLFLRTLTIRLIPEQDTVGGHRFVLADKISFASFFFIFCITIINIVLSAIKRPAKPSDINDPKVGIMNFTIQLAWLTAFALNYWSILSYYKYIFEDVIGRGRYRRDSHLGNRYRWDRIMSNILHGLVIIWWISSFLWTIFQDGLQVDQYWKSGPNTAYMGRIWYTNIAHIILNILIVLLPIVWIRRAQHQRWGRLVYMLLFLSGILTSAISGYRLWLLRKRFGASAEYRYELSILAVMCSVIEANVAIICTNIPTLDYQVFLNWYNNSIYGTIPAETARRRTIGFDQGLGHRTENPEQELDVVAEQHRPLGIRVIDF